MVFSLKSPLKSYSFPICSDDFPKKEPPFRVGCSYIFFPYGDGSKPWYLVNPKIAGKWMFIPLKMVLIGIDP